MNFPVYKVFNTFAALDFVIFLICKFVTLFFPKRTQHLLLSKELIYKKYDEVGCD